MTSTQEVLPATIIFNARFNFFGRFSNVRGGLLMMTPYVIQSGWVWSFVALGWYS